MSILSMRDGSQKLNTCNIRIIDAIALCHIVDKFEEFTQNLAKFSKGIFGDAKLNQLYNFIKDEEAFVKREIKTFYLENYKVLDAIHKYSYISNFLFIYFNNKTGEFNYTIMQMYEYIKRNKDKKDNILVNLNILKELGFEIIKLDEAERFDKNYTFDNSQYSTIEYFDGDIRVTPSYHDLKYAVSNANYQISVNSNKTVAFSKNPEIILNNLVFEPSKLPKSIEYDYLLSDLMSKRNNDSNLIINNTLRIGYDLNEIDSLISNIEKNIQTVKEEKEKERALIHIGQLKEIIIGLEMFLQDYEDKLINSNEMTRDELAEEKKLYKNYRYNLKLDID